MLVAEDDEQATSEGPREGRRRTAMAFVAVSAIAAVAVVADVGGLQERLARPLSSAADPKRDVARDADGDGLPDRTEVKGWLTQVDGRVVTDPRDADTDADGLSDGVEAGELTGSVKGDAVYVTISHPTERDTDADGIEDGAEIYSDMDPRERDTDGDGLADARELDFGSDPTLSNPDDDRYSDKQEYDRGSDPMAYDLGRGQAISAFLVGAAAGDSDFLARSVGRLNDAQIESPEYLAGHLASGVLAVGDIRDLAVNIGTLDPLGAVTDAGGLVPGAGDTAKAVTIMTKFARHSARAERAVATAVEGLPGSKRVKQRIYRSIFGSSVRLPPGLAGGPKNYIVYKGTGYIGITDNFERRAKQHAARGRSFTPVLLEGATGLSRGEARAIEETCILEQGLKAAGGSLENIRHSISPSDPTYEGAVAFGKAHLKKLGVTCS